jgi:hypothetical protein
MVDLVRRSTWPNYYGRSRAQPSHRFRNRSAEGGGLLFGLALTVAVCSIVLLYLYRRAIPIIRDFLPK